MKSKLRATAQVKIRVLGIRNNVALVEWHKEQGYVNCQMCHLITVPPGQSQMIDPRFIVLPKFHLYPVLKEQFFYVFPR